jgi:hypothetical protein
MSNRESVLGGGGALVVLLFAVTPPAGAQSPYDLSARQSIPFVVDVFQQLGERTVATGQSEINVHNPGAFCIRVQPTYMGAVGSATPGQSPCSPRVLTPGETAEFSLRAQCPQLNPGLNYGRLELFATSAGTADSDMCPPPSEEPSDLVFLANARVGWLSRFFTVEAFPLGQLSANKSFAVVNGLKSGLVDGYQWASHCYAEPINESMPVFVRLQERFGNPLGAFTSAAFSPPAIEMQTFLPEIFTAVGAPPGNYSDVTARFATSIVNGGGQGGGGIFGFCLIDNQTTGQTAFQIAKYLDNNDEAREARTAVSHDRFGGELYVRTELPYSDDLRDQTNVHVAYFQHPDRIHCHIDYQPVPSLATFDMVQMRLIDPDNVVVAGGPHVQDLTFDLGDKSQRYSGRNGRWLVEVGPDRIFQSGGGLSLYTGGLQGASYTLTCTSGNGHNQLDVIGHCRMDCQKDVNNEALCPFDAPFEPKRCYR